MEKGIQTFCQNIGEYACYALSIMKIAEWEIEKTGKKVVYDVIKTLQAGIDKGYIYYGEPDDQNNFYVEDPEGFFRLLTGKRCVVTKADPKIDRNTGDWIIERWERHNNGHFRLPDWDSIIESKTVKYGRLESLRVFKVL